MAKGNQEASSFEIYFRWWLEELKEAGLVVDFKEQPESIIIASAVPIFYDQHYKTKDNLTKSWNLFQPITYGPDAAVVFSEMLLNKLFGHIDEKTGVLFDDRTLEAGNVYENTLFYTTGPCVARTSADGPKVYTVMFDVKPPASAIQFGGKTSREFSTKSRMIWENYGVFINKVVPVGTKDCLFAKTFTPKRYLFTDGMTMPRKITKWTPRSLEEWLSVKEVQLPKADR